MGCLAARIEFLRPTAVHSLTTTSSANRSRISDSTIPGPFILSMMIEAALRLASVATSVGFEFLVVALHIFSRYYFGTTVYIVIDQLQKTLSSETLFVTAVHNPNF